VRMHVDKTRAHDHVTRIDDLPYGRHVWGNLGKLAIPYQHISSKPRRACAVDHGAMLNGIVHGAFPSSLLTTQCIALELSRGAKVQRLNNAGIDCCNDVHGSVQICFRDTSLPCIRKASLYSRLTITYEGNRQSNKYLLALAQVSHRMRISIKLAEIRALTHCSSL